MLPLIPQSGGGWPRGISHTHSLIFLTALFSAVVRFSNSIFSVVDLLYLALWGGGDVPGVLALGSP